MSRHGYLMRRRILRQSLELRRRKLGLRFAVLLGMGLGALVVVLGIVIERLF